MPFKKHNPGCPCCCPNNDCDIFDWPEDGTLSQLDQLSGTWQDSTETLWSVVGSIQCRVLNTSDDDALLIYGSDTETDHASVVGFTRYSTFGGGTSTQTWRQIVGWKDASNYAFAHIRCVSIDLNASKFYVRIGEVVGGVETYFTSESERYGYTGCGGLGQGVIGLRPYLCLHDGLLTFAHRELTGSVNYDIRSPVSDPSALGKRAGIKTITSVPHGRYDFHDLQVYHQYLDCYGCQCTDCQVGKTPESLVISFDGVKAGTCADVSFWNGNSFVADRFASGGSCIYTISLTSAPCGLNAAPASYLSNTLSCSNVGVKNFKASIGIFLRDGTGAFQNTTFEYLNEGSHICCPSDCVAYLTGAKDCEYKTTSTHPTLGEQWFDFSDATVTVESA